MLSVTTLDLLFQCVYSTPANAKRACQNQSVRLAAKIGVRFEMAGEPNGPQVSFVVSLLSYYLLLQAYADPRKAD